MPLGRSRFLSNLVWGAALLVVVPFGIFGLIAYLASAQQILIDQSPSNCPLARYLPDRSAATGCSEEIIGFDYRARFTAQVTRAEALGYVDTFLAKQIDPEIRAFSKASNRIHLDVRTRHGEDFSIVWALTQVSQSHASGELVVEYVDF